MSIANVNREFERLRNSQKSIVIVSTRQRVNEMVTELKQRTPVDTGLAQSSWKTTDTEKGVDVRNDVEYIQRLNEGSSKQAPAHFIEAVALKYGTPSGMVVEVKGI